MIVNKIYKKSIVYPPPPRKICLNNREIFGRSMIEMLGVLAVVGILSAGGIMGYSVAMENYRVNKTLNDMREMAMKTQTLLTNYGTSSTSNYVDTHKLHQVGIIPDDYYATITGDCGDSSSNAGNAGCYMKSPIATTWIAYREYLSSVKRYRILYFKFFGVPYSACVKIATADWSNLVATLGVNFATMFPVFYDTNKPISRETAESWCSKEGTELRFTFYLSSRNL